MRAAPLERSCAPSNVQNNELCRRVGVLAIERKRDQVSIRFRENASIDPERLARFVAGQRGAHFTPAGILKFTLKATRADDVLNQLRSLLGDLAADPVLISPQPLALSPQEEQGR